MFINTMAKPCPLSGLGSKTKRAKLMPLALHRDHRSNQYGEPADVGVVSVTVPGAEYDSAAAAVPEPDAENSGGDSNQDSSHSIAGHVSNDATIRPRPVSVDVIDAAKTKSAPCRDKSISEAEVQNFIDQKKKPSTVKATARDVRNLQRWLLETHFEMRPIQLIPVTELAGYLAMYFISVRKSDGTEYEPGSLTGMLHSFERHLVDVDYEYPDGRPVSLIGDPEFKKAREALKAKRLDLKQQGKGSKPNRSTTILLEEEEEFWVKGICGNSSAFSIQFTLWYYFTMCFGLRGRDEHRKLRFGDISVKKDGKGMEFLEMRERDSKTRDGATNGDNRQTVPKYFCTCNQIPERCIVELWKFFVSKRPTESNFEDSPLYLTQRNEKDIETFKSHTWFKNQPMGVNLLGALLPKACKLAGIPERGNHGARATSVQRLRDAKVPDDHIIQITGHRNVNSLQNYDNKALKAQNHPNYLNIIQNIPPNKPKEREENVCHQVSATTTSSSGCPVDYFQVQFSRSAILISTCLLVRQLIDLVSYSLSTEGESTLLKVILSEPSISA